MPSNSQDVFVRIAGQQESLIYSSRKATFEVTSLEDLQPEVQASFVVTFSYSISMPRSDIFPSDLSVCGKLVHIRLLPPD